MRSRRPLSVGVVAGALAFVALGAACVDLFHSTNFETYCDTHPDDTQCGGDGATDAGVDVIEEPAVDARPPHPDFCSWSSPTARGNAARACAWLGACEGPEGESAFGACVVRAQLAYDCNANPYYRPAGATDDFWACLANVKSCGDVDKCVFPGGVEVCERAGYTACAGQGDSRILIRCDRPDGGLAIGVDPCMMRGQTCTKEDPSTSHCSGGMGVDCNATGCTGSAASDCTAGATKPDLGVDCARYGATCVSGGGTNPPLCAPGPSSGAKTCVVAAKPTCSATDGGIVTGCLDDKAVMIDCNRLGLPCDDTTPIPPYDPGAGCTNPSTASSYCTNADSCLGATLTSCGRGLAQTVDCAAVGLGACIMINGHAACTKP